MKSVRGGHEKISQSVKDAATKTAKKLADDGAADTEIQKLKLLAEFYVIFRKLFWLRIGWADVAGLALIIFAIVATVVMAFNLRVSDTDVDIELVVRSLSMNTSRSCFFIETSFVRGLQINRSQISPEFPQANDGPSAVRPFVAKAKSEYCRPFEMYRVKLDSAWRIFLHSVDSGRSVEFEFYPPDSLMKKPEPIKIGILPNKTTLVKYDDSSILTNRKLMVICYPNTLAGHASTQYRNALTARVMTDFSNPIKFYPKIPISGLNFISLIRSDDDKDIINPSAVPADSLSTIVSGTIRYFRMPERVLEIGPEHRLSLDIVSGDIYDLSVERDGIHVSFHGTVRCLQMGSLENPRNVMPSCLEIFHSDYGIGLIIATILSILSGLYVAVNVVRSHYFDL